MYFCHIENFAYGEINERSFGNPHPRTKLRPVSCEYVSVILLVFSAMFQSMLAPPDLEALVMIGISPAGCGSLMMNITSMQSETNTIPDKTYTVIPQLWTK